MYQKPINEPISEMDLFSLHNQTQEKVFIEIKTLLIENLLNLEFPLFLDTKNSLCNYIVVVTLSLNNENSKTTFTKI